MDNYALVDEAIILLLQDLRMRKSKSSTERGEKMKRHADSLLDRLGAPYRPSLAEAEEIPTEDETTSEIGSNWFTEWVDEMEEAAADLIPERQGRDGLSANVERHPLDRLISCLENDYGLIASWDGLRKFWNIETTDEYGDERVRLADQLADAGNTILDLRQQVDVLTEQRDKYHAGWQDATKGWTRANKEREELEADLADARARVAFLEGATDRLSDQCRDLMAVNIRLRKEKNKEAVERIEGVA
ncbi:MAG: hypothetical protein IJ113_03385 [Eggerthellaceae bacterium]|nr:hypothetical protein [Eggerthellaceae bacterium]MBQ9147789.1 hypothetical protein [Rikenellaceae bacterium]